MRKKLITTLFFTLPLLAHAQSDSLKSAYQQVCTTLKEYKFLSEDADDGNGKTRSITLKVQQGNFVFTIVDDFGPFNDSFFGNRHGTKTIKVPVAEARFSISSYYAYDIEIGSKNGVELTYKGKKDLLKQYEINGEDLSLRKLHKELTRLKEILLSEEYTGSLGTGRTTSKKSAPKATPKQEKKKETPVQPRQRKHVQSGN